MVTFVEETVRVSVPATSANLGPGFDSLGLALGLRDELSLTVRPGPVEVVVRGEGAGDVPLDESHLVLRSVAAALDLMGAELPGVRLECRNVIPHSRGLGSSSAAIVAGVVLARAAVAGGALLVSDDALFQLAADIEGHPDNVAPAFFGGFTIAGREAGEWFSASSGVDPRISTVVFIPPTPLRTEVARGLLPDAVPHADAAANAGRTALLVAALAGQPELLLPATRDWLHQSQREPAMPDSVALVESLRAAGIPAVVSGAGPTVLAFAGADPLGVAAHAPAGWRVEQLAVEPRGAFAH